VVVEAPALDVAAVVGVDAAAVVAVAVAAVVVVVELDELSLPHPTANRATATRDRNSVAVV
jgi:hypothetical protein